MKAQEKNSAAVPGVSVPAKEMSEAAEKAIASYQTYVENETGGSISKSRAIVAILERSEFAKAL